MRIAITALAFSIIGACATNHGTQAVNDFNQFMELKKGETTILEIYEEFGQPHHVIAPDDQEMRVWSYFAIKRQMSAATLIPFVGLVAGGDNIDATTATFEFNEDDVLQNVSRTEQNKYANMWAALGDSLTPTGQVALIEAEMERLGLPFDRKQARNDANIADAWMQK